MLCTLQTHNNNIVRNFLLHVVLRLLFSSILKITSWLFGVFFNIFIAFTLPNIHTDYGINLFCSLRVNLDMGKAAYGWMIMKDDNIPGTVVRTSTIPEELGRLVYLLTDKTGIPGYTSEICWLMKFLNFPLYFNMLMWK